MVRTAGSAAVARGQVSSSPEWTTITSKRWLVCWAASALMQRPIVAAEFSAGTITETVGVRLS
jgi:hypothetical protein